MRIVQSKARIARVEAVVAASAAGLLLVGCTSSGLSENETPMHNYSALMYSDNFALAPTDPAANAPVRALPREPIRVAVAQVGEIAPPQSMLDALRARPDLFSQVTPISDAGNAVQQMSQMRQMARDFGADYLLVFGGNIEHGHTQTGLSVFDLTIAGAFVVPSNAVIVDGKAAGALIDLRTAQPVMSFSSEAKGNGMAPTAFAENAEAGSTLADRDELVKKLTGDVVRQLAAQIKDRDSSTTAPAAGADAKLRG